MFNELAVIKTVLYGGSDSTDKNGKASLMFLPIAGRYPNLKQVNSGTLCERKGMEVGKVYLVRVIEKGESLIYGKDFDFEPLQEITSGLEIIKLTQELGQGQVEYFNKPAISDEYNRTSNAIESERTRQIKAGTYIPVNQSSVRDHSNAKEVYKGTSQEGEVVKETRRIEKLLKEQEAKQEGQSGKVA